jgi:hypothetical protein
MAKSNELFIVGVNAPTPPMAIWNYPVPDIDGKRALTKFHGLSDIPKSICWLDMGNDKVGSSSLYLERAMATLVIGAIDPETGTFTISDDQEIGEFVINGIYDGLEGTELKLFQRSD